MELKKKAKTFNTYTVELSFGQIEAICAALEQDHSNSLSDELLAELRWYCDRVPGPGEDEEKTKPDQESGKGGGAEGAAGDEESDLPIPMPPGSEAGTPPDSGEEPAGFPPEHGEEPAAGGPTADMGLPEEGMDGEEPAHSQEPTTGREPAARRKEAPPREPGAAREEADHHLAPPPRE